MRVELWYLIVIDNGELTMFTYDRSRDATEAFDNWVSSYENPCGMVHRVDITLLRDCGTMPGPGHTEYVDSWSYRAS